MREHGKWLNAQTAAQVLAALDAKKEEAEAAGNAGLVRKIEMRIGEIERETGYAEVRR